ncbi:MAG: SDR family oxidoreductase [Kiritimatiellae bacterium]|nr:SDR family oxidoreductase [Kiritimatiellia bacterium]
MIEQGKTYVVMGLLDSDSIAYAIGRAIVRLGGRVVYTAQNERMKSIFFDRADQKMSDEEKGSLDIRFCDITKEEEIRDFFSAVGPVEGVVHSIAYGNPKTCLGEEFHTDALEDIKLSYHISCASLARVAFHARRAMDRGGSIVALTFDTSRVYAYYNWMGVHKAALEALVRALARRHGRDLIRVNAVSAGPLHSKAASKIPGFNRLRHLWRHASPLPWDVELDKHEVANAVVFLLGNCSKKITGQTLAVDGGASVVAGSLMPFEQWHYSTTLRDDPHEDHVGPVLRPNPKTSQGA